MSGRIQALQETNPSPPPVFSGSRFRAVFIFLLPLVLIGLAYNFQTWMAPMFRGSIRVVEPLQIDTLLFGMPTDEGRIALPFWLQERTHPFLDLLTGIAYITFIPGYVLVAGWIRLRLPRPPSTRIHPGDEMMWAFLVLSLGGYLTWMLYPAAPPWYFDLYGPGTPDPVTVPEPAGAARFDALVGLPVFAEFYARNTNVFGAIPSLHVSQTFLALLYGLALRQLRIPLLLFFILVLFGSVYLNHHYLIDGITGMLLAGAVFFFARRWSGNHSRSSSNLKSGS